MPSATAPFTVTVTPPNTAVAGFTVTIDPPSGGSASTGFTVTMLPNTALNVAADKTAKVRAGDSVTLTGSGSITSWTANHGVTLAGSGSSRTFTAPAFADTTVVRVSVAGAGSGFSGPAPMGYIGDSLTVQNVANGPRDSLYGAFGYTAANLKVDGVVGRSIVNGVPPYTPTSQEVVATWRAGGFHPHLWTVGLISNNFGQSLTQLKTAINTLLDVLMTEPPVTVMWVGPVLPAESSTALKNQIPTMYQALNEVAAARTDLTMRVFDISSALHNGRDETGLWNFGNDSPAFRHMTNAGYTLRNQLIAQFIDTQGFVPQSSGGSAFVDIEVKGQPSAFRSGAWAPLTVVR